PVLDVTIRCLSDPDGDIQNIPPPSFLDVRSADWAGYSERPQMPVVEVRNLSHSYGEREALDGVSFSVERGEVFGFLGPNGSGKTTLFRLLCTLISPPPGTVSILGHDPAVDRDAVRRDLGVVFQSP